MNRLDTDVKVVPLVKSAPAYDLHFQAARRLAVVIVEVAEEALLASRILELAKPLGLQILLIGVAPDRADERKVRRQMVTLAAFLREGEAFSHARGEQKDRGIHLEIQVVQGKDWLGKIKALLCRDDMLACYSEQVVGSQQRPLTDILASSTNVPIYSFSGLRDAENSREKVVSQAAAWLVSLASIAGFFLIQARIVVALQGWAQTLALLLTLFAEAGVIWLVNSLFAQS